MKLPGLLLPIIFVAAPVFDSLPLANFTAMNDDQAIIVPVGGNTWAEGKNIESKLITAAGIKNWADGQVHFVTYLRVNQAGRMRIRLKGKTNGKSRLRISLYDQQKELSINGDSSQLYDAGEWQVKDSGYIKIDLSGLSKTSESFADISDYEISGSAINAGTVYVKNNEGNFFYWGRRGPSVHLNYPFADSIQAEWFYNEVTVPKGQDIIGSYFMATGFGEGYFGIQVNSLTERRILFSVWSPFNTDDPKSIPAEKRIVMLKKGEEVVTGEFGNEGSGGQSYLRYNWKADTTYRFLLHGEPDKKGNTVYAAYFFAPEKNKWMLIASFKRPGTNTYLKKLHSFLENFDPEQGDKERKVLFGNGWIRDVKGNWLELTRARFTYDNTAVKRYRLDYAGGIEKGKFFLKNCGFFNEYTAYGSLFDRPRTNTQPSGFTGF